MAGTDGLFGAATWKPALEKYGAVTNLTVVKIDAEKGQLFISGAIPGRPGTLVEVRSK